MADFLQIHHSEGQCLLMLLVHVNLKVVVIFVTVVFLFPQVDRALSVSGHSNSNN